MDKEKLEKWLNKLAKSAKQLANIEDFDDTVQICELCRRGVPSKPYIQLYSGIMTIAELFDLDISVVEDEDSITRSFMWNGVEFMQYDRKGECS